MIGICIGIGGQWPEIAHRAASRMHKMTSLRCHVIEKDEFGCVHPSWLKCHVTKLFPDENDFLVMDADIVSLHCWNPEAIFREMRGTLCAVPDVNNMLVLNECQRHDLPFPDWYINCGFMMFSRHHQYLWDETWKRHPRYGTWLEQTAFNKAIADTHTEICRLPRRFNTLPKQNATGLYFDFDEVKRTEVVNLHAAGVGGDCSKILALQKRLGVE